VALAQSVPKSRSQQQLISLPNLQKSVTLALRGVPLATALSAIGREGGFGVVVSDAITGDLNTDLSKVTIEEALQALANQYDLQYTVQGGHTAPVILGWSCSGLIPILFPCAMPTPVWWLSY
jgi:type II secretory pathway component GspD/PulD (secretin)